ncbi:NUDIX hydrolase [Candidatus Dojkabacteria bacterium]|uniref:NUDIX hydrolase n=1 Tax=Candidatus Dojkabacteria bacterium TaxID=2099670 RepID=A0A955I889_9BACT|nr:NUDIX hydrolase [Candidatus Dojkabacteria bacterium]
MKTKDNAKFHIVAVKAWVKKGDRYLLARRSMEELHMPGAWSLPGGKVENDEDTIDILQKTLKREIFEEVGLEITNEIELLFNNTFKRSDGSSVVGLTFFTHWKSGEAEPLEETSEVEWFTIEELLGMDDIEYFLKREISVLDKYHNLKST